MFKDTVIAQQIKFGKAKVAYNNSHELCHYLYDNYQAMLLINLHNKL